MLTALDDLDDLGSTPRGNPVALRPDWSMRMAVDVAIGASVESIMETYNLQHHDYTRIVNDAHFLAKVAGIRKSLEKEGASFRLKAQLQAEELLATSWQMIHDPDVPSTVRAALIKDTVRWASWDNPQQVGGGPGGGFSININLGNAQQPVTIEGETVSG